MIVNEPKRRGRLFFFIWTGILLVGIAVMLYPKVGKIWNAGRQSRVVDGYERSVEKLDARKEEEIIAQTRAYNVMLLEQNNPVPNDKNADSYGALLNMTSDGVMGYLEIPEIRVKLPIYHGTGDFAICNGAGHVEGSSFPIGGKGTHAVLSSHRGLPGAKLFSDLDKQSCFLRFYNIDPIDLIENRLPEHCNCKIVSHLQLVQIREKFRPRQSSVGRKHRMCSLSAYRETASFHMSCAITDMYALRYQYQTASGAGRTL